MQEGFQVVDHVADMRVRAWGPGFQEVFTQIAKAMWFVMLGETQVPAQERWHIEITGIDMEDLLVGFLNEQLAVFEIDGLVVSTVQEIVFEKCEEEEQICLKAIMCGSYLSNLDTKVNLQIKAATFHGLQLTPTEAWVTFDV